MKERPPNTGEVNDWRIPLMEKEIETLTNNVQELKEKLYALAHYLEVDWQHAKYRINKTRR